jgi:hypothetical protein
MRLGLALGMAAVACVLLGGCSDDCADRVIKRYAAPDGRHSAVLFDRDCGATTGFNTQISILRAGERLSGGGNVFIADTNHNAVKAAAWGGPWADVIWLSPSRVLVGYVAGSRVSKQRAEVSGVKISYRVIGR